MSVPNSAWRFECCNRLLNVLADRPDNVVQMTTRPISKRHKAFLVTIQVSTTDGGILATCRHEISPHLIEFWQERLGVYARIALEH